MNLLKLYTLVSLLVLAAFGAMAQQGVTITGVVVESSNQNPVGYATVTLTDAKTEKTIDGVITDDAGEFQIETTANDFYVEISFIGFEPKKITEFSRSGNQIDLGTVGLQLDAKQLTEVVVEGERSQTVFELDKRVFNVGTDLSSTGASALEVLNNVPSVNVNIEGQISLRGSTGVQILINGKPSVLASEDGGALGSITADMIESIEVITNPSAKYDAEGTSGILNIILKKSEKKGLNGSVTVNGGTPTNNSIGLSLNRRTEKFNLFSQIGYGRRIMPRESSSSSLNRNTNTTLAIVGDDEKQEDFFNLILGTDYHINDLNVVTLSGRYAIEDEEERGNQAYSFINNTGNTTDAWNRNELTTATNPKWEYELQYKKDFAENEDKSLLFSAMGNSFSKEKTSAFTNTTTLGSLVNPNQDSETDFSENEYIFKLDYTHPFNDKYTLEVGSQYVLDDVTNTFQVRNFNNSVWEVDPNFSNVFDFNQNVLGVYSTFAYEGEKWGIKGGLRLEDTDLETNLVTTNQQNNQKYNNLFPSMHTSYNVSDDISLQAGYSRRIYRPRLWDLNPFFSFRDNFNISTGNPNLRPEYSDSYEINSIYEFDKGSLNFGVYHLATDDVIEDITMFSENVTTTIPENIGTNNATGLEFNAEFLPSKAVILTTDFNFNTFTREGQFEQQNFDFTGNRWNTRTTGKFKLPADFTIEATGNYQSKFKTVQGEQADNIFMNFGARKKMMKGRLNANLSVRDVFASRRWNFETQQPSFIRQSNSERGRFVTLGLSFGFGKGEAMEFSGQKRF